MALEYSIVVGAVTLEGRPADAENCTLLQRVTGLDGRDRRSQAEAVAGNDGDVFGPSTRAGITLTIEAELVGATRTAMRTRERALRQALEQADAGALLAVSVVGRDGDPVGGLRASMRVAAPLRAPDSAEDSIRHKPATFALEAELATWKGPTDYTSSVLPPGAGTGLSFSFVFPLNFGGSTAPGTTVTNAGDAKAWPELRLYGYSLSPVIENLTTGERLSFSGLEVPAGDSLVIRTQPGDRSVRRGDVTSVYSTLDRAVSSWLGLVPGANSIRFTDQSHDAGARLDVLYADAYR